MWRHTLHTKSHRTASHINYTPLHRHHCGIVRPPPSLPPPPIRRHLSLAAAVSISQVMGAANTRPSAVAVSVCPLSVMPSLARGVIDCDSDRVRHWMGTRLGHEHSPANCHSLDRGGANAVTRWTVGTAHLADTRRHYRSLSAPRAPVI